MKRDVAIFISTPPVWFAIVVALTASGFGIDGACAIASIGVLALWNIFMFKRGEPQMDEEERWEWEGGSLIFESEILIGESPPQMYQSEHD